MSPTPPTLPAGNAPFSAATIKKIDQLKQVYDLDLTAADSHKLNEGGGTS